MNLSTAAVCILLAVASNCPTTFSFLQHFNPFQRFSLFRRSGTGDNLAKSKSSAHTGDNLANLAYLTFKMFDIKPKRRDYYWGNEVSDAVQVVFALDPEVYNYITVMCHNKKINNSWWPSSNTDNSRTKPGNNNKLRLGDLFQLHEIKQEGQQEQRQAPNNVFAFGKSSASFFYGHTASLRHKDDPSASTLIGHVRRSSFTSSNKVEMGAINMYLDGSCVSHKKRFGSSWTIMNKIYAKDNNGERSRFAAMRFYSGAKRDREKQMKVAIKNQSKSPTSSDSKAGITRERRHSTSQSGSSNSEAGITRKRRYSTSSLPNQSGSSDSEAGKGVTKAKIVLDHIFVACLKEEQGCSEAKTRVHGLRIRPNEPAAIAFDFHDVATLANLYLHFPRRKTTAAYEDFPEDISGYTKLGEFTNFGWHTAWSPDAKTTDLKLGGTYTVPVYCKGCSVEVLGETFTLASTLETTKVEFRPVREEETTVEKNGCVYDKAGDCGPTGCCLENVSYH